MFHIKVNNKPDIEIEQFIPVEKDGLFGYVIADAGDTKVTSFASSWREAKKYINDNITAMGWSKDDLNNTIQFIQKRHKCNINFDQNCKRLCELLKLDYIPKDKVMAMGGYSAVDIVRLADILAFPINEPVSLSEWIKIHYGEEAEALVRAVV